MLILSVLVSSYFALGVGVWLSIRSFVLPTLTAQERADIGWQHALLTISLWWLILMEKPWEEGPHD